MNELKVEWLGKVPYSQLRAWKGTVGGNKMEIGGEEGEQCVYRKVRA